MEHIKQTIADLYTGEVPADYLEKLREAVKHARKNAITDALTEGARVAFASNVRPKYLIGHGATVKKVNQKTATVVLDDPAPERWRGKVRVPFELLEVQ